MGKLTRVTALRPRRRPPVWSRQPAAWKPEHEAEVLALGVPMAGLREIQALAAELRGWRLQVESVDGPGDPLPGLSSGLPTAEDILRDVQAVVELAREAALVLGVEAPDLPPVPVAADQVLSDAIAGGWRTAWGARAPSIPKLWDLVRHLQRLRIDGFAEVQVMDALRGYVGPWRCAADQLEALAERLERHLTGLRATEARVKRAQYAEAAARTDADGRRVKPSRADTRAREARAQAARKAGPFIPFSRPGKKELPLDALQRLEVILRYHGVRPSFHSAEARVLGVGGADPRHTFSNWQRLLALFAHYAGYAEFTTLPAADRRGGGKVSWARAYRERRDAAAVEALVEFRRRAHALAQQATPTALPPPERA